MISNHTQWILLIIIELLIDVNSFWVLNKTACLCPNCLIDKGYTPGKHGGRQGGRFLRTHSDLWISTDLFFNIWTYQNLWKSMKTQRMSITNYQHPPKMRESIKINSNVWKRKEHLWQSVRISNTFYENVWTSFENQWTSIEIYEKHSSFNEHLQKSIEIMRNMRRSKRYNTWLCLVIYGICENIEIN